MFGFEGFKRFGGVRTLFEFAQMLAEQVLKLEGVSESDRIDATFQRVLIRQPSEFEQARLQEFLEQQKRWYAENPEDAKAAAPGFIPDNQGVAEAAAWTALSRVLLNLDEFITRE